MEKVESLTATQGCYIDPGLPNTSLCGKTEFSMMTILCGAGGQTQGLCMLSMPSDTD
jgi:hypothetical protein